MPPGRPRQPAPDPLWTQIQALLGPCEEAAPRRDWKDAAGRLCARLVQAQADAERKLARLSTLLGSVDEIVFELDEMGTYLNIWTANESLLVRPKAEMLGRTRQEVLGSELADPLLPVFRRVLESGEPETVEYPIVKDGREQWYQARISRIAAEAGAPRRLAMLSRNITERKRAEAALQAERRLLETLLSNLPGMAYRCRNDPDWSMEYVSEGCRALTGYPPETFLVGGTKRFAEIIHPADRPRVWKEMQEAVGARAPFAMLYRISTAEGRRRWVWEQGSALYGSRGEVLALEGFISDVTERRLAEEALAESENKYRRLFELESDAIFLIDNEEGRILEVNSAAERMYGYCRRELLGLKNTDLSAEPEQTRQATREQYLLIPIRYHRRKDGHVFPVEITASHLTWKGRPAHIAAIRDISQRLAAEEALQGQRAFLRRIIDADPNFISVKDPQGRYVLANRALADFYDLPVEALIGKSPLELTLDAPTAQAIRADDLAVLEGRAAQIDREHLLRDARGRELWKRNLKYPLRNEAGEIEQIVSYTSDITALKETEEALRRSEKNYRLLFMDNPMPMLVFDVETLAILAVNDAAVHHYGYSRDEFHAMTIKELRPAEEVPRLLRYLAETPEGIDRAGVWRHRKKDGSLIDVEITAHPSMFADRKVHIVLINDVTERLLAERIVRESEEKFRALFENAADGIMIHDEKGRILEANRAFCERLGYEREEILGMNLSTLDAPEFAALIPERMARLLTEGHLVFESAHRRKDGEVLPVEVNVRIMQITGRPACLSICRDLTERRRAEAERKRLEEQVQHAQKLESLGVLAGGIAHDFNNLLTGILGHADLALSELSPLAPARDSLQQIELSARRAAELTRQMLAYSGRGKFVIRSVQLCEVVQEMSHLLEISISKKCVLKYHFAENLPPIEADVTQLRQVVMNLILNASEAIGDRSGVIAVSTGAMECDRAYLASGYLDEELPEGAYVYLEVADTGCGMDRDTLTRIFDPFFTTKFTGRGLGLAAVLGIVRGHRGVIKVYSEPARGTTFKVLFPVSSAPVQADAERLGDSGVWSGTGTVLVVDDEETVRVLAKRMLERMGFEVLLATDGREGVEVFQANADRIVAVLLDMTMPHMDGEETFRELRRLREDIRVVLSSGYNEQDATNRFAGKGLAGFIQKPYRLEDLAEVMRNALGA